MKNKSFIWGLVAVVVVALVIWAVRSNRAAAPQGADLSGAENSQNGNSLVSTEDLSAGSANAPKASAPTPAPLSYARALELYAAKRIQFDAGCQAIPNAATFKNGTLIMLDNRSGENRVIHMGSLGNYSVKAWGFKIVDLSSDMLPNPMAVDCGPMENVAIVTVQR